MNQFCKTSAWFNSTGSENVCEVFIFILVHTRQQMTQRTGIATGFFGITQQALETTRCF